MESSSICDVEQVFVDEAESIGDEGCDEDEACAGEEGDDDLHDDA